MRAVDWRFWCRTQTCHLTPPTACNHSYNPLPLPLSPLFLPPLRPPLRLPLPLRLHSLPPLQLPRRLRLGLPHSPLTRRYCYHCPLPLGCRWRRPLRPKEVVPWCSAPPQTRRCLHPPIPLCWWLVRQFQFINGYGVCGQSRDLLPRLLWGFCAEDNSVNQKLMARMLQDHCRLEIVSNGAEAVERVRANPMRYALIFMDINVRTPNLCLCDAAAQLNSLVLVWGLCRCLCCLVIWRSFKSGLCLDLRRFARCRAVRPSDLITDVWLLWVPFFHV
jgi:hypothetical protein